MKPRGVGELYEADRIRKSNGDSSRDLGAKFLAPLSLPVSALFSIFNLG